MSGPVLAAIPIVHFAGRYRGSLGVDFHQHLGIELVLVTHGSCAVRVEARRLVARPGEAFILPEEVPHNQEDVGDVETTHANITVRRADFSNQARVIAMPIDGAVAGWLGQLADMQTQYVPAAVRSGLTLAIIESIAQHEQHAARQRLLHPGLVRALHRIDEDHLAELTVNDLARVAELSPSHLTALFRSHVGCGPLAFVQRQRLERACRMLRNEYVSVAETADACGYADANYFSRLFRQTYQCSPSEWRKQQRAS